MPDFPSTIDLGALGGSGMKLTSGEAGTGDQAGRSVAIVGDVNDDGIDDFVVGIPAADPNGSSSGAAYLVFGKAGLTSLTLSPSIAAADGIRLSGGGPNDDAAGGDVEGIGDINDDGIDDFAVTAQNTDGDRGSAFVIFGKTSGWGPLTLNSSIAIADGFKVTGQTALDRLNRVASAGDINDDGIEDYMVAAQQANTQTGAVYVLFGKSSGLGAIDLSSLSASDGFRIQGEATGNFFGGSIAPIGDFNDDGVDDILIGAAGNSSLDGAAYVIFGKTTIGSGPINLATLAADGNGFKISGGGTDARVGSSVGSAGDFNNDGVADLVVGANDGTLAPGAAYVILGKAGATTVNLGALANTDGFKINGFNQIAVGHDVANAGDVNGDGFDDVMLGVRDFTGTEGDYSGATYVILGKAGPTFATINVSSLAVSDGFTILGEDQYDYAGYSVDGNGDINGDGAPDMIIGALGADGNEGAAYIVFGLTSNTAPTVNANAISIVAEGGSDTISSLELDFDDAEQADTAITYTVTSAATNGTLRLSGGALALNDTFTQADINNSLVTYSHNGGETTSASFGFSVSDGAGGSVTNQTFNFTVTPQNDAPAFNGLGGAVAANEQTTVLLDNDAVIADAELDARNGGNGNYQDASLTIARQAGASAQDDFGFDTTGALFTVSGGNLQSGGQTFATFTDSGGTLTISFTSSATAATSALVDDVLRRVTYTNLSNAPPASVVLGYTFDDGSAVASTATATKTVNITALDDDPTLDNPIIDQTATEDRRFSFQFAANTFGDADVGDTLTYSAQLAGGGALPAWLSFDAITRTFSGTPREGDQGTISVDVIASDGGGTPATDTFDIVVSAVNDAPVIRVQGTLDIVTVNNSGGNLSVLLGDGSGGVGAETTHAVGVGPRTVALGDIDGDGDLDMVADNFNSNTVSVLLGNGLGGFAAQTTHAVGVNPTAVALGDLDGDGDLDIVAANASDDNLSVLLGNGSGGFAAPTTHAAGNLPRSVALGDLNGDGDLDIVAANVFSDDVSVLIGDGSGGFAAQTTFAAGDDPASVALGDINGDGDLDIVTANGSGNNVSVLIGDGLGGFAAPTTFAAGSAPQAVALGDLDGDGDLDIVTANFGSNNVSVLLGNASGGFAAQTTYAAGANARSVSLGDLDGDGDLDIVTANQTSNDVSVLLGNGSGGFGAQTTHAAGSGALFVALGHLDNAQVIDEDQATPLIFNAANGNAITLSDADHNGGDETVTLTVGFGTLTLATTAGLTSVVGDASGAVTLTGSVDEINAALDGLSYVQSVTNYNGAETLEITADDGGNTGGGGAQTATKLVPIVIQAVNDAPAITALDDSIYTEGAAFGRLDADGSVLISDVELDPLNGGNGDYTGAVLSFARTGGADADDSFGLNTVGASFTYGFDAGAGHDVLKVGGTIVADGPLVPSAGAFSLSFVNNGFVPSRALLEEVMSRITYANSSDDPPPSVTINVTFNDGNSGSQGSGGAGISVTPVVMTITPVNDAPTAADNTISIDEDHDFGFGYAFFLSDFGFSDAENDDFQSVTIVSTPLNGVLFSDVTGQVIQANDVIDAADIDNGDIYFIPDHDENGAGYASFDFQVTDDGGTANGGDDTSDTHTITFDVTAVNDAPRIRLQPGLDVVGAEPDSDGVAIASGDGNGFIFPSGGELTGTQPEHVVLADFDGDGHLDIATSNKGDDTVTILLGDSCGCFDEAPGSPITVGDAPGGMDVGFINNDLIPDLVVANTGGTNVTALIGNGDGTFTTTSSNVFFWGTLKDVALADFNNDSILDLVSVGASATDNLGIAMGNGAGGFGAFSVSVFGSPTDIVDVETAQLNAGTFADVVAVDRLNDRVRIFLGAGNGTTSFGATLTTGDAPEDAAIGDVNGDTFLDIVVANGGSDTVGVFLGNGAGGFGAQTTFTAGDGPSAVALADMNEDGDLDIVAGHEDGSFHVLLGAGNGTFTPDPNPLFSAFPVTDIAIGQVDPEAEEAFPLFTFYTEGTPVTLAPRLALADVDGATIQGATVFLDDFSGPGGFDGDVLSAVTTGTSITATWDDSTFTLTLSGADSVANYQKVLRTVTFDAGDNPDDFGNTPGRIVGITVDDGTDEGFSAPILVQVVAVDDLPTAANDAFIALEASGISGGNLLAANPTTADSDPDGPGLQIVAVNGSAGNVNNPITLASGAFLTVTGNGTFNYDPSTAFAYLPGFGTSGASNTTATDSFTYTLLGGVTATVNITVRGSDGAGDILQGTAGIDILVGGIGSDTIRGSAGADQLRGGSGADDSAIDTVDYSASALGVTVNLSGGAGVGGDAAGDTYNGLENVIGTGQDDTLTGNGVANVLTGGNGSDTLDGGLGADTLNGGIGNDTYHLGAYTDTVADTGGSDTFTSTVSRSLENHGNIEHLTLLGAADINGTGNNQANTITGNSGNNGLTGGMNLDTLIGGLGDDTYFLEDANDIVVDTGGYDTISSVVTRSLAGFATIERLVLDDKGNINGFGNALDNRIYGGDGNNGLTGGAGLDNLYGGLGDDTYFLEDGADTLSDTGGRDTIASTITRSLADYAGIERLILQGTANIDGTGTSANNDLYGNTGNNHLDGGAGNDLLVGGAGKDTLTGGFNSDTFRFGAVADMGIGVDNRDLITDFVKGADKIDLSPIDANGALGGDTFTFLAGLGATFTHVAGQLRFFHLDYPQDFRDVTVIEGDIDGNAIADFQIGVAGHINLAAGDFVL